MEKENYKLCLYVAGQTQKLQTAIKNLQKYCKEFLEDNYTIKVDLREHPQLPESEQIIAISTLMKKLPVLIHVLIGDLSNKEKFLVGIN